MTAPLQATPLRDFHLRHGARLVDFAGWEMPVHYGSILEEHRAVRTRAGLFDVSHMGEADVKGPDALRFLQALVTNDVARLFPGRVLYSPMCQPDGGTVDDLLVYMRGPDDYFLCLNASNTDKDLAWMRERAAGLKVEIRDRSAETALVAVQGPAAAGILQPICDLPLGPVGYYHFAMGRVAGVPCLVSRTGYTGEDGFELYHPAGDAPALAEAILNAGSSHGLALAGLGARDSLRLEAGYPLYGHELSETISPLAAGLGWTVKFDKGPFAGSDALLRQKTAGLSERVRFFRTGGRRIARAGAAVRLLAGEQVGRVLSGTLSPVLNEAIGSALVAVSAGDQALVVDIATERAPVTFVRPPFVPLPPKG